MDIQVFTENGRVPVTVMHVDGNIDAQTYQQFQTKAEELNEVFVRDPGRGIREWEGFQRNYPQAAEVARSDAMLQIKNFERLETERRNSQRRLPRTDRDGEQMDF